MFSRTSEYALRAMICLAQNPDKVMPTGEIARRAGVPSRYLTKLLYQVARAGHVTGRRGIRGGYTLSRPTAQITPIEVIRAVSQFGRVSCAAARQGRGRLCSLHALLDRAAATAIEALDSATLQDVIDRGGTTLCAARPDRPG